MTHQPAVEAARIAFLRHFAWSAGHADLWPIFADGVALAAVVEGLAEPWQGSGVTHVAGIESRGFLLGGAVAVRLGVGFLAVRKSAGMLPGPKLTAPTAPDYRGLTHLLRMQDVIRPADTVVLVDDWAERGSQAGGVANLLAQRGARLAGLSLLVDQLADETRRQFGRVTSLVRAAELGDS
ncbi:MAG: phosphoribosyltransferase [Actinomycetota bacterium]|nr:phosphoribosyltransferase [Actinomycetota bacterium]MDQ2955717.1 phosphoribosyltransferase [Actinomycetota bacterium]